MKKTSEEERKQQKKGNKSKDRERDVTVIELQKMMKKWENPVMNIRQEVMTLPHPQKKRRNCGKKRKKR